MTETYHKKILLLKLTLLHQLLEIIFVAFGEPDYETLKRIAAFFHVSTDYMLGTEQEKANDPLENELLLIFRTLKQDQKELLLEQGKLLLKRQPSQR